MENLAHALMGRRIGQLPVFQRVGPRAAVIGMIAANVPDLDVILYAFDRDLGNWQHRGCTHSLLGWPVIAALGAVATFYRLRTGRFRDHLGLWAAGVASHAALDVPTTWGTQLLWPNDARFGLELIFIVDPMFWLLLGLLPWWLSRRPRAEAVPGRAPAAGILALGGWYAVAAVAKALAVSQAPEPVVAVPAPLAPLYWTAFTRPGPEDTEVRRYFLTPWSCEAAGVFGAPRGAAWDAVQATHTGERDTWMSVAPAILREESGDDGTVTLGMVDLAYSSWANPGDFRFGHVYTVAADGTVGRSGAAQSQ
jgi:membrane-bound metal-dependent hydrolase YbcI (DUF457 family)